VQNNRKYRDFEIIGRDVPASQACYDNESESAQLREYTIVFGEAFRAIKRKLPCVGCAVLPTAGYPTWVEAQRACDILVHVGVTPDRDGSGFGQALQEFYALSSELHFQRAYVYRDLLPKEQSFIIADFTVVSFGEDNQPMVSCPELCRRFGLAGYSFSIPMERFPANIRRYVNVGEVFTFTITTVFGAGVYGNIMRKG